MRADERKRAEILEDLSPLLFGPSPAILTSRPSYFATLSEYKRALRKFRSAGGLEVGIPKSMARTRAQKLADRLRPLYRPGDIKQPRDAAFLSYTLELLTQFQVHAFLTSFDSRLQSIGVGGAKEVLEFIESVYDLPDLIQRPILLHMVISTILEGEIDITDKSVPIGPAELYEAYTGLKLQLDWDKAASRRSFLTPEQRRTFAVMCAWKMHLHGQLELDRSLVEAAARETVPNSKGSMEELLTDLRTCSFLTISQPGNLRFVHKSFYEFFVARRLKGQIDEGLYTDLARSYTPEIQYFLGAFAFGDADFRRRLKELAASAQGGGLRGLSLSDSRGKVLANICGSILHSQPRIDRVLWNDVDIDGVRTRQLTFADSSLTEVKLLRLTTRSLSFLDCTLQAEVQSGEHQELWVDRSRGKLVLTGPIVSTTVTGSTISLDFQQFSGLDMNLHIEESRAQVVVSAAPSLVIMKCQRSPLVELKASCKRLIVTTEASTMDLSTADFQTCELITNGSRVHMQSGRASEVAAKITSSALLVSTAPHVRGQVEVDRWRGRDRSEQAVLEDSVLVAYPTVDLGWMESAHLQDIVLVGGTVPSLSNRVMGVTFLVPRSPVKILIEDTADVRARDSSQEGRDSEAGVPRITITKADFVKGTIHEGQLLVIEGSGIQMQRTMDAVERALKLIFESPDFHLPKGSVAAVFDAIERRGLAIEGLSELQGLVAERVARLWPVIERRRLVH